MAELLLWKHIRNKLLGTRFLRQHIIGDYIVDFVSLSDGLVIEVDGAYHAEHEQMEMDEARTYALEQMGFKVIRFTNEEILYNIEQVKCKIMKNIKANEQSNLPLREGRGGSTLFDKIWDAHVVQKVQDGPTQLYIDRLYCHEVTTPQAFDTLRDKNIGVFRPEQVVAMPDHNTPSDQQERIDDPVGRKQVETLAKN